MRIIARRPCSYGGQRFFKGDVIPNELITDPKREEKFDMITIEETKEDVFTEQIDTSSVSFDKFEINISSENGIQTPILLDLTELQQAVDIIQTNAEDSVKAIADVSSEAVLIFVHAIDSRSSIKKAAKKRASVLDVLDEKPVVEKNEESSEGVDA